MVHPDHISPSEISISAHGKHDDSRALAVAKDRIANDIIPSDAPDISDHGESKSTEAALSTIQHFAPLT
jgi:hypothetical protein